MTDWPAILSQHGGVVWKTVRRLLGNEADAADCFQETFVAAFDFSRQQPVENWVGLLKRLATVRALDVLRRRYRNSTEPLLDRELNSLAGTYLPSSIMEENELFDQFRHAITQLPPDQAEVCCLRFLENLSYEQIAEQTGVSVNHVGVLLHRAKSALQLRLAAFAPITSHQAERKAHDS